MPFPYLNLPTYHNPMNQEALFTNLVANMNPTGTIKQEPFFNNFLTSTPNTSALSSIKEEYNYEQHEGICNVQVKIEENNADEAADANNPLLNRIRKRNRAAKPRYEKNICAYILKKVFRAFLSAIYQDRARQVCQNNAA